MIQRVNDKCAIEVQLPFSFDGHQHYHNTWRRGREDGSEWGEKKRS